MPEAEDDPLIWDLARILAAREAREADSDYYNWALDLITQMRGRGYTVEPAHG